MKKSFYFYLLSFLVAGTASAQKLKVKTATELFKSKRYYEANTIFDEVIHKGEVNVNDADSIYRMAIVSAQWAKNMAFQRELHESLTTSVKVQPNDVYNYFRFLMTSTEYDRAKSLLSHPLLAQLDNERASIIGVYKDSNVWADLSKNKKLNVTTLLPINSDLGDFVTSAFPGGYVLSSSRDDFNARWSYDHSPYLNIYVVSDSMRKIERQAYLCDKHHDGTAFFDTTNSTWYFAKNYLPKRGKLSTTGIFMYNQKTKEESVYAFNDPIYFLAHPYLSPKADTLWFSSDRSGGFGGADIWYSVKSEGAWGEPINAGKQINTIENEMFPVVNGSYLFFSSAGLPGLGGLDLFKIIQKELNSGKPENFGEGVNSSCDDFSLLLSNENKGVLSSNRGDLIDRVYGIEIKLMEFFLKGKLVPDVAGLKPLNEIKLFVRDGDKIVDTIIPDASGNYLFKGVIDKNYTVSVEDEKFTPTQFNFSTIGKTKTDTVYHDFNLASKYVVVQNKVIDTKSKKPLPNATLHVKNLTTGQETMVQADANGEVQVQLDKKDKYEIRASEKGYMDQTVQLSFKPSDTKINETLGLQQISKGVTVEVENVFYDFGLATLRPESKNELNKLVEFLAANPTIKVELSSHTDSRGSNEQNQKLSQKRAQSCVDYLISQGIKADQIVAKGYGETKLLNKCKDGVKCSEDEHQINRRTEMKVLSVGN
jgi:outer membrane protein OmpA-like peptidoglycan-associated protein